VAQCRGIFLEKILIPDFAAEGIARASTADLHAEGSLPSAFVTAGSFPEDERRA